ncbi:methylated-DNA--[protein]-cysteine S-methyltransferase [Pseudomonas sp. 148P]|uniref:Methylated-DNA--protein-cysteine methyltransferase n=1 Tax=Pseudomonas ulcerans TaxID=3115852 RepID=A0ABU7HTC5_9PSED|nr:MULTISPECIES: methylated-DNA--[protein]-cysteine S-methyltransferase [unclassified Pseudomonas]MEE1923337.1 methylated-DNA--[protein]-cysteine S-methyltransferase [Pseudomonas sp. 147P]MEE1934787.1 methylated-DNA--[protein]-cysteine S-methyltransferase [Pseudomonas sp. 148P]
MFYATTYQSPVGPLHLASSDSHLMGLWMAGQKYFGGSSPGELVVDDELPFLVQAKTWLDRYFAGEQPPIADLPMAPLGSDFRQAVWTLLCEIPYGETTTYGEIAKAVAARTGLASMSSQAVGGAVGHNPISIIIPCHRVIGRDGSLTGYAGGIEKKIHLLEHEGALSSLFYTPTRGTAL